MGWLSEDLKYEYGCTDQSGKTEHIYLALHPPCVASRDVCIFSPFQCVFPYQSTSLHRCCWLRPRELGFRREGGRPISDHVRELAGQTHVLVSWGGGH